jgi:hypothetical protein
MIMVKTVIGIFDNVVEAQQAVQRLYNAGFSRDEIDMTDATSATAAPGGSDEKEGGVSKFFKNLFSSEEDSDKYVRVARYSESVVTVMTRSASEAEQAAVILESCGAVDVDKRAASYAEPAPEGDALLSGSRSEQAVETGLPEPGNQAAEPAGKVSRIPVMEEHLRHGQVEVLTGGTRLRSRIIERPAEALAGQESENLQPHPVLDNRTASASLVTNFTAHEIELTETKEVPIVSKEARVVEELRVGKEVEVRTETLKGTVRKTEIDVENVNGGVAKTRPGPGGIRDRTRDV